MNRLHRQRGATLMIALTLLAVMLLLGAASTSLLLLDERAARNHRDHLQARLAAQAALEEACEDIARLRRIDPAQFDGASGCRGDTAGAGLCLGHPSRIGWDAAQLLGRQPGAATYGQFTGRRFAFDPALPPPRYLIERLSPSNGTTGSATPAPQRYRLSAIGHGRGQASAALQAVISLPAKTDGAMAGCRWLAWRTLYLPSPD